MKKWQIPAMQVVELNEADVIATSGDQDTPIKNNTAAEGANQGSEIIWN